MNSHKLDETAIFEVAREIGNPVVRAKYLEQIHADKDLVVRLEERLTNRRRWQFALRGLLIAMLVAAALSAVCGIYYRQAVRLRQEAMRARLEAERAMMLAEQARVEAGDAAALDVDGHGE